MSEMTSRGTSHKSISRPLIAFSDDDINTVRFCATVWGRIVSL